MNISHTHRLSGAKTSLRLSPNHGSAFPQGLPDTIVIHYTAGASLESSVASLCNPASKASAHVVVGRDGRIVQLVPFNQIAWHAGASSFGDRNGLNKFSIGIEIDNAGRLAQTAAGNFLTWFGRTVSKKDTIQAVHRNEAAPSWWHTYTEQQIERVFELCELLARTYPITTVVGHEDISPGRKSDPGPAFPLARLCDRTLGSARDADAAFERPAEVVSLSIVKSLKPTSGGVGKPTSGGVGKPGSGGTGKPKSASGGGK